MGRLTTGGAPRDYPRNVPRRSKVAVARTPEKGSYGSSRLVLIARVMAWAHVRQHQPLDLAVLAAQAYMSVRTFTRRFQRATGSTPGRWLTSEAGWAGGPNASGLK